jgi:hypothetical protein
MGRETIEESVDGRIRLIENNNGRDSSFEVEVFCDECCDYNVLACNHLAGANLLFSLLTDPDVIRKEG